MTKIKNPTLFSDYYGIDPNILDSMNLFNPVLNVDTKLFIDPFLLQHSKHSTIKNNATKLYKKKFEDIILLLSRSSKENDIAWRNALRLLPKREIEGTCLGYGSNSISGRSISEIVRIKIIQTASEIIKLGIKDPDLFMLLPLFEKGIGPDTISDITTSHIEDILLEFTIEKARALDIKTEIINYKGSTIEILRNPLRKRKSPIILLPKDILRHLPIVNSWEDIADAASFNSSLRDRVNNMISQIWEAKTLQDKARVKKEILHDKVALESLLQVLKNGIVNAYDLEKDDLGLTAWQKVLSTVAKQYPKKIDNIIPSEKGLKDCVKLIIDQFTFLVEERGLNKIFWKSTGFPNNEKVVQMVFFAVAYSYCKANDIDINPEMNTGNGLVDFKFSSGFTKKVIVEIKNSYNRNIIPGFQNQLRLYMKSEKTSFGFYVIVDVGKMGKKYENLIKLYNNDKDKKAEICYVNAEIKPTPSKLK